MTLVSGTLTIVCPMRANPNACLGVPDRPGLVEAVDEGAVLVGVAALLGVAAQAEVAVADGEERLGRRRGRRVGSGSRRARHGSIGNRPRSSGSRPIGVAVHARASGRPITAELARSSTTRSAPASRQRARPGAAVDADHQPEVAGRPRADAGDRVLEHDRSRQRSTPSSLRPRAGTCRARACPAARRLAGDRAVDHDPEAVGEAGGLEHRRGVGRRARRPRAACPASRRWSSSAPSPGRARRRRARARR